MKMVTRYFTLAIVLGLSSSVAFADNEPIKLRGTVENEASGQAGENQQEILLRPTTYGMRTGRTNGTKCRFFFSKCAQEKIVQPAQSYGYTQIDENIGLRGAVREAIATNPLAKAAHQDTIAARAAKWRSIVAYAPIITGSIDVNRSYNKGSSLGNSYENNKTATISVTMPIFTSGRLFFGARQAQAAEMAARFQELSTHNQIAGRTINAYLQYYFANRSSAVLSTLVSDTESLLVSVRARRNGGFSSDADVAQVVGQLANYRAQLNSMRAQANASQEQLDSLVGHHVSVTSIKEQMQDLPVLGLDELLDSALTRNADLMVATHRSREAEFSKNSVLGSYLPQVNLSGDYSRDLKGATKRDDDSWRIGVRLTMPIVNLAAAPDVVAAKAQSSAAYYRAQDTRRQVELTIRTSYDQTITLKDNLDLAHENVQATARVTEAKKAQFKRGVISLDRLLEQRAVQARAEMDKVKVQTELFSAKTNLLIQSGRLNEVTLQYQ